MKLSKNLGRVATTFLATAMLASLTAVPAFAADGDQFTDSQVSSEEDTKGDYTVKMTKNLTLGTDLYQPSEKFSFSVKPYLHGEQETHEPLNGIPVSDGVANGVSVGDAEFKTGTTKQTTADIEITVDLSAFTGKGAGVYKYTLTETAGDNPNVTYDGDTKYLYVIIENDKSNAYGNNLQVGGVVVKDKATSGNTGAEKSSTFDNEYDEKDDNTDTLHNLTLTKKIEGLAASLGDEFRFKIQITNSDPKDNQVLTIKNGDSTNTIVVNGEPVYYDLGNNETVQIIGLREGDSYTITEDESVSNGVNSDGYTVYINDDDRSDAADSDGVITAAIDADSDEEVAVSFLNYRDAIAPTGIVTNVAPYALLVVIAAAGCFVFLRKRRED